MKKILILTTILVFIFVLIFNLKNIYKILPVEKKLIVKNFVLKKYENLSDESKILIRVLRLEPFKQLQIRYKRQNPGINNLNNDYNVKFLPNTQTEHLDGQNTQHFPISAKRGKVCLTSDMHACGLWTVRGG